MKLYCFAGPNGSGKSTLFSKIVGDNAINVPFINADDISRCEEFSKASDPDERNLLAAQYAEKLRHDMINNGKDFADLTNMKAIDKKITLAPTTTKKQILLIELFTRCFTQIKLWTLLVIDILIFLYIIIACLITSHSQSDKYRYIGLSR